MKLLLEGNSLVLKGIFTLIARAINGWVNDCPGRGLTVKFRENCGEMQWKKIIFIAYSLHLFAVNGVNLGELFIFTAFSVFLQKRILPTGAKLWPHACPQLLIPLRQLSLTSLIFYCEFKPDWVNVGKQMRWIYYKSLFVKGFRKRNKKRF